MMKRKAREKNCNVPKIVKHFQNCTKLQLHIFFPSLLAIKKQIYNEHTKVSLSEQSTIQNNV